MATAEWVEDLDACIEPYNVLGDDNYGSREAGVDKGCHLVSVVKNLCPEKEFTENKESH